MAPLTTKPTSKISEWQHKNGWSSKLSIQPLALFSPPFLSPDSNLFLALRLPMDSSLFHFIAFRISILTCSTISGSPLKLCRLIYSSHFLQNALHLASCPESHLPQETDLPLGFSGVEEGTSTWHTECLAQSYMSFAAKLGFRTKINIVLC